MARGTWMSVTNAEKRRKMTKDRFLTATTSRMPRSCPHTTGTRTDRAREQKRALACLHKLDIHAPGLHRAYLSTQKKLEYRHASRNSTRQSDPQYKHVRRTDIQKNLICG